MSSQSIRVRHFENPDSIFVFRIRLDIQTGVLSISDDYFLTCFYPNGRGDPNDLEKNFLRSGLLLKVQFFLWAYLIP